MSVYVYWITIHHSIHGTKHSDCLAVCSSYEKAQKILDMDPSCKHPQCDGPYCVAEIETEAVPYEASNICYDILTSQKMMRIGAVSFPLTYRITVDRYYQRGIANTYRESLWHCTHCGDVWYGAILNRGYRHFMNCVGCGIEVSLEKHGR
jgi:hypothetical protein